MPKAKKLCCVTVPVACRRKVTAKGRCQSHYRYFNRHGVDNPDPLIDRKDRSDLLSLSVRVSSSTLKLLRKCAGGAYRKGSAIIEEWAAAQR